VLKCNFLLLELILGLLPLRFRIFELEVVVGGWKGLGRGDIGRFGGVLLLELLLAAYQLGPNVVMG
jgi:hypothetical protein